MGINEYMELFEAILASESPEPPYDNAAYLDYTRLNLSRSKRWLKTGEINSDVASVIKSIKSPMHWILISEPWCGDAAHNVPFIQKMAALNENITLEVQLRDSPPFLIEQYLTNGGKSIPKLVARDANGQDVFEWGPRPQACQDLMLSLKKQLVADVELKENIQQWYNLNKGQDIQQEFKLLLQNLV